ncbi:MAG: FHA domain-containing protein [Bacteroidaceae bacterium]|nr:FHA domain-containing protein [Bacteroidaceae bacterium]
MATKKCPNGHQYDSGIYGDNCPFCPSGHTHVNSGTESETWGTAGNGGMSNETGATIPQPGNMGSGDTTFGYPLNGTDASNSTRDRRVVGILVSFSANEAGEVYKVYEGKNIIGRGNDCDIPFPDDSNMSREHLLIQYIEAKGVFRAVDRGSSNGTYINGQVCVLGDIIEIKTNDVIVLGSTKFIFLAIPQF